MKNIEVMTPRKKALLEKNMKSVSYRNQQVRENKNLKINQIHPLIERNQLRL